MTKKSIHGFTLALILAVPAAQAQERFEAFEGLSRDLIAMKDLFAGGSGKPVTFDSKAAQEQGFAADSIGLAEELTAFSNQLADTAAALHTVDVSLIRVELVRYPRVASYFDQGTKYHKTTSARSAQLDEPDPQFVWAEYWCGSVWRPRPAKPGAPWRTHTNISNPTATLRGWGYHPTPTLAGGGWTRPQSWSWAVCKFNTYRDHAYQSGPTSIREQLYAGFTPRGEPNPEVYWPGAFPWPYPTWPAYVYWWHQY
jgi:hypothetical protein